MRQERNPVTAPLHTGRDQYRLMIKWSSGQGQKYLSTPIPYCVRGKGMIAKVQLKVGKVNKWKNSRCPNWIRVEYFPGFTSLQILQEIQNNLHERNIKPEEFTGRIVFMSMFNDIDWTRQGNDGICFSNPEEVKEYAKIPRHTVMQCSRVSVLWVVEFWKRRMPGDTKHFNSDASNTELLFRIILQ